MLSIMIKCQVVVGLCKYSHFLLAGKGVSSSSAGAIGGASAGGVVLLVASIRVNSHCHTACAVETQQDQATR